ncbi:MAG: leucine-rich repeat protein [Lachnospiraceae bacterium]|nr:leucine-rich repeat protein [Lachnospiraceae bacterium]
MKGKSRVKKIIKSILAFILSISIILGYLPFTDLCLKAYASSYGSCGNNVRWDLDDEGVLTISGTGPMYNYALGSPLWEKNKVKKVVIESGVTNIAKHAFYYNTRCTSIEIPSSVTSIGYEAFHGCSSLTTIEIPSSVTSIENEVFRGCSSLTTIEIPSSITSIGDYAFADCSSLNSIEIPSSVTSIGAWAFSGCSSLSSIEIPSSITSIGERLFYGCSRLTNIVIPTSVTSIGSGAFYGCSSLSSVEIPSSVTSIENEVFRDCSGLSSVEIPSSVTSIGEGAFHGCSSLSSIEIPSSVTSIGSEAFYGCSSLSSIEIPSSVTSILSRAFYGCMRLTSIGIPSSVTRIADYAFSRCDNFKYGFYSGTSVSWNEISIGSENDKLTSATIYYNVDGVALAPTTLNLIVKETYNLTAMVFQNSTGNKNVSWESSNTSVATVVNGRVRAVGPGIATITVRTEDEGKTATCEVTVTKVDVSGVTLNPTTLNLKVGENESLTATVVPNNASFKAVTWESSKPSVASVEGGVVTAVGVGEATITATTVDGNMTATCAVTVTKVDVLGVTLNPTTLSLKVGESGSLTATVAPNNATNKALIWTSSASSVAKVVDGIVTAVGQGTANITVVTEDGGKTATCVVMVSEKSDLSDNPTDPSDDTPIILPDASSVTFSKSVVYIEAGKSEKLSWTVLPADAKDKSVSFVSSDTKIAAIDYEGNVIGVATGTVKIYVKTTVGGYTDECSVIVIKEGLKEKVTEPEEVSNGDILEPSKEKSKKSYTSVSYKGETIAVDVTTTYQDAVSYNGTKIDAEALLSAKTDKSSIVKNVVLNEKAAADKKTAADMISVKYVCTKKAAGKASFYAKVVISKDAKKYMTSAEFKKLKKIVSAINKKLKKDKFYFNINKRSVTDGTLTINVQKEGNGAIKLKKGKPSKVKSILLNTKDATGKISISR